MVRDSDSQTADGHDDIIAACKALDEAGADRDRLRKAAMLFWQALRRSSAWPQTLRSEGAAVVASLFRYGPIEYTIAQFNDESVAAALRQLEMFCEEFRKTYPTWRSDR